MNTNILTLGNEPIARQGDLLIQRIDEIPAGLIVSPPEDGKYIAAHSETGHHHWLHAGVGSLFKDPADPFICYLRVDAGHADFVHARSYDTHKTIRVPSGNYKLTNQLESSPEGWRRAAD